MTSQRMISAIAVLLMAFSVKANDVTAEVKQRLQTLYPATTSKVFMRWSWAKILPIPTQAPAT